MVILLRTLARSDRTLAWLRPGFLWLGQLAMVVLGTHLACEVVDDALLSVLLRLPIPWAAPDAFVGVAAWAAVGIELLVSVWAAVTLFRSFGQPVGSWRQWWERRSIEAFVRPLFWAPVALTGCWVIGMAVEDLIAPVWVTGGWALGWLASAIAAWRLGWTGLVRVTTSTPETKRWWYGAWDLPVLVIALLATAYGLPIWGWWPW